MRLGVAVAVACLAIVGLSIADESQASIKKHTDIPAENLGTALQTLAKDRNFQIVYVAEEVSSLRTQGAVGEFTPDEALKALLKGTGLTFRYLDEKTITIVPVDSTSSTDTSGAGPATPSVQPPTSTNGDGEIEEGKKGFLDRFRVAQLDQGTSSSSSSVEKKADQPSQKKPDQLEEVIVTAQKREERLMDVPISIVSLSADELQKRQITTIDDLPFAVPGLTIADPNAATHYYSIRGIGNIQGGSVSRVGLYLDEADVTLDGHAQLVLDTYDLDRVEVLRGPQGTLYGDGSEGGTIRFITKNPILNQFNFDADVAALWTEDGAPSQRISAVVNVPLIDNELGIRIAGAFDNEGGWMDQPAANLKDINGQDKEDLRVKALWQPTQDLSMTGLVEIFHDEGGINEGEDANGNFTQVLGQTTTPQQYDTFEIYNLTVAYDLGPARLLSSTSDVHRTNLLNNAGYSIPADGPPTTTPEVSFLPDIATSESNLSQELRLTSASTGPWEWTVGGYARRLDFGQIWDPYYFGLQGSSFSSDGPYTYVANYQSKSWAVFGDTSYKFWDRLTLGAGVRYFRDDRSTTSNGDQTGTFHSVDPRFYAQYKLTQQINFYASVAKGFSSGGFNSPGQSPYGPEDVWTYELGTKLNFLEGRLSADIDVFYSNYDNYQIFGVVGVNASGVDIALTSNEGNAVVKGTEWNFLWHPVDHWSLSLNGAYLDTYFTKINLAPSSADYAVGDNLDFVDKYQGTVSVQRDFAWNGRSAFARLDYSLQGPATERARATGPWYFSESNTIHMLNFHASLDWSQNLRLGIFAQNLLNDRGFLSPDSVEHQAERARPLTLGVEFGVKFD